MPQVKNSLPAGEFMEEDPDSWTQPIAGGAAASAGKQLWDSKTISDGGRTIKAECGDCHAKNGRDLKYFNYSNKSIIERSIFHGLTETEGKQIVSYIRSLDVPNPGRPWNPPYQPGPGLDSKPVNEWSAGAGIDWVLEKDEMAFPFIFPNGVDTSAISLNKTLNVRETPVMLQFPDWNHWLPVIHPYDASFGENFFNSAANKIYNGRGSNSDYTTTYNLTSLIEGGPDQKLPWGPPFRSQEGLGSMLGNWENQRFLEFFGPYKPQDINSPIWTRRHAQEIYSGGLWLATKQWELIQGNDLEGMGKKLNGNKAEERTWPGTYRHVFELSPSLEKHPPVDSVAVNNNVINFEYLNNVWYHMQPVLNSGNLQAGGFGVVDWDYAHGNLDGLRRRATDRNLINRNNVFN
ncbi:MAG TPA: hypothetical protein VF691_01440, partial [Cytophagaceae bacterium]